MMDHRRRIRRVALRHSTSHFMRFSFSGSCCGLSSKCFGERETLLEGILCHLATEWHTVVYYFFCEMSCTFFDIGCSREAGVGVRQSSDSVQTKVKLRGGPIQCVFDNCGFLCTDVWLADNFENYFQSAKLRDSTAFVPKFWMVLVVDEHYLSLS